MCPGYISRINSNHEKQIVLLILQKEEKEAWHYLAIKKLSVLLHGITLKHIVDFYCLNCHYPFRTENKIKSHEKVFF